MGERIVCTDEAEGSIPSRSIVREYDLHNWSQRDIR